jgi:DNA polymerase-1
MTELSYEALSQEEKDDKRFRAKAGNFGFIYGMGVTGFISYARDNYGVTYTLNEATDYRNGYFEAYPKLLTWHRSAVATARQVGYCETLYGRRRYLRDLQASDSGKSSKDERDAVNTPVQGTSGEWTQTFMEVKFLIVPTSISLQVNTVHDSDVEYVRKIHKMLVTYLNRFLASKMNSITQYYFGSTLPIELPVDVEWSDTNWKSLSKIK